MSIRDQLVNLKENLFLYLFYCGHFDLEKLKVFNIEFDKLINKICKDL